MLETYTLKQHLDTTRQELSQALYQHDAACRVIAKLMKERDEARAMLNALQTQGINLNIANGSAAAPENGEQAQAAPDMEVVAPTASLGEDVLSRIMGKHDELSKGRKGRKAPSDLATREAVCGLKEAELWTPHESSKAGVTALAVTQHFNENAPRFVSLTGGVDKSAIFTDLASGHVLARLTGHSKRVSCVAMTSSSRPIAVTGSVDRQVKVLLPRVCSLS
jgi:pre-mRNA-processing factor 19